MHEEADDGVGEEVLARAVDRGRKAVDLKGRDKLQDAIEAYRAFAEKYPAEGRAPMALVAAGSLLRQEKNVDAALAIWRGVTGR